MLEHSDLAYVDYVDYFMANKLSPCSVCHVVDICTKCTKYNRCVQGIICLTFFRCNLLMATALQQVVTHKLFVNHRRINGRKHFFSERIVEQSPTQHLVSFKSLSLFRRSLSDVNLGIYTKY